MRDLIDRQAALNFKVSHGLNVGGILYVPYAEVKKYLGQLTTAEPQIVRCKDCKYRFLDKRFGHMCDLDSGDPYCSGRNAEDDNWFCADARRREDGEE